MMYLKKDLLYWCKHLHVHPHTWMNASMHAQKHKSGGKLKKWWLGQAWPINLMWNFHLFINFIIKILKDTPIPLFLSRTAELPHSVQNRIQDSRSSSNYQPSPLLYPGTPPHYIPYLSRRTTNLTLTRVSCQVYLKFWRFQPYYAAYRVTCFACPTFLSSEPFLCACTCVHCAKFIKHQPGIK